MLLERERRPGRAVRPSYSAEQSLYSHSARDVIFEPASPRAGFDGVEQGLSAREPMRGVGMVGYGRRVARSYHEDQF